MNKAGNGKRSSNAQRSEDSMEWRRDSTSKQREYYDRGLLVELVIFDSREMDTKSGIERE